MKPRPPESAVEPKVGSDIEVVARRELALRAIDAMSEVLGVEVSVGNLLTLAEDSDDPTLRLNALRALRCVESIGREGSRVIQAIGEAGIYHYVETVIVQGADERKFLELMKKYRLTAAEVAGLYELRRLVGQEINTDILGFPTLLSALRSIGIQPWQAAADPEEAVEALIDRGIITDHVGRVTYSRPIFAPRIAELKIPLLPDVDTPRTKEPLRWVREHFEGKVRKDVDYNPDDEER